MAVVLRREGKRRKGVKRKREESGEEGFYDWGRGELREKTVPRRRLEEAVAAAAALRRSSSGKGKKESVREQEGDRA